MLTKLLLSIEGGAGKNIAATGAIKEAYNNDISVDVITAHPSVLEGNPHINKIYDWTRYQHLKDSFKDYDRLIFREPYREECFLKGETDLTGTFNYLINGKKTPEPPEFYYSKAEIEEVKGLIPKTDKPLLALQTNGGQTTTWNWCRDIHTDDLTPLLKEIKDRYHIIHLKSLEQPELPNTTHTGNLSLRQSIILLKFTDKRILIDSVFQHAAKAMGKKSIVLWNATDVNRFGYKTHINIQSETAKLKNVNRIDPLIEGLDNTASKCPYHEGQMIFDYKKILKELNGKNN